MGRCGHCAPHGWPCSRSPLWFWGDFFCVLAETKTNHTRRPDVVVAFQTCSHLCIGTWLFHLQSTCQCVALTNHLLFQLPLAQLGMAPTFGISSCNPSWSKCASPAWHSSMFILIYTSKFYSFSTYQCGGCSRVSCKWAGCSHPATLARFVNTAVGSSSRPMRICHSPTPYKEWMSLTV